MFEKQRQAVEANKNYQKVKAHVQAHQTAYTCVGSAVTGGLVVGVLKSRPVINNITNNITNVTPNVAPVFNNHNTGNVVENTINNAGRLHKIIKRINADGTETVWETIGDGAKTIAEERGVTPERARWILSRCVNGHIPDVYGDKVMSVGVGTR